MAKLTPAHVHDCGACRHMATVRGPDDTPIDLYVCPGDALGQTWIARYSSDGADYSSSARRLIAGNAALRADPMWRTIAALLGVDLEAEGRDLMYRAMRHPSNLAEWTAAEAFAVAYRGARVTMRGIVYPDGRPFAGVWIGHAAFKGRPQRVRQLE